MSYTATVTCTKRAWIRDQNAPVGFPAKGKISCPCKGTPESYFADGKNVNCLCGRIYDSKGYILKDL